MQRLLLALARWAVQLYYRVEHLGGGFPAHGPVLLVGNHPNGLVDPVLVASASERVVRFLGKAPLFELPLLGQLLRGLRALPVYRGQDGADTSANEATFEAVFAALGRGEVVCLFPEGKSHDEPELARLKTGAARMLLGAEERAGFGLGVALVPVGLVYRSKRRFRSRVAVWTGTPFGAADLAALHRRDARAAVTELTARIAAGLRAVTLDLERWEDRPLLELAERILPARDALGREPPEDPRARLARLQALSAALRELRARQPERVDELSARIATFGARLARLGLEADDLPGRLEQPYRPSAVLRFTLQNLALLVLGLPLAALGALFWILPERLAGTLGRRLAPGADTVATYRILAACLFFPAWLGLLALLAWSTGGPAWGVLVLVAAPSVGTLALAFRDWRRETAAEVRTFLRLAARRDLRALLARERAALANELRELGARLAGNGESRAGKDAGEERDSGPNTPKRSPLDPTP